ncbi:YqgE/AlgH family protein [Methylovirgula sp. HY1]|uniref:YqgE/AlgH family protein n=1 Tax=Methylovirgula sp. HY1 TaxID=2822761 RepID=UPI001C5B62B5|nr:YqgE/AlgH family protein [Methylovirgula sp. HY1]
MAAFTQKGVEAEKDGRDGYLDGQLLLAMPGMPDDRFARSVIYMCAHSDEGAMGIIINRAAPSVNFSELLVQLEVIAPDEAIRLPSKAGAVPVLKGGPVETGRGFVLHTNDFFIDNSTLPIDTVVSLTATVDILRAIASGAGPGQAVLALGYAGWSPGQLEEELQQNGWLTCPADASLIFDTPLESKYDCALRKLGIDPSFLSTDFGHA